MIGQIDFLRVALGLHCALYVAWVGALVPAARGVEPSANVEQGNARQAIENDAIGGERLAGTQKDRRMQTTELLTDGCETWECPVGYTNKRGACLQPGAGEGRLLIGTFPTDDDWRSDDEYTVVDDDWVPTEDDDVTDTPVCTQDICCEAGTLAPTPSPVPEGPTCDGGIPGVQGGDVCCLSSCGTCRGIGCSSRDGGPNYTGREACCNGGVHSLGRVCSAQVGAPCVFVEDVTPAPTVDVTPTPTLAPTPAPAMVEDPTCDGGIPGIQDSDVCCVSSCGSCAGAGCGGRDGGDNYTGSEACCRSGVRSLGRVCSAEVGAPCVIPEDTTPEPTPTPTPAPISAPTPAPTIEAETEMCTVGVSGILLGDVCCPSSCGACGGTGCSQRDGGGDFSGSQACCSSGVRGLNRICSAIVGAPCLVDETETEMCTADVPGILLSDVCCPSSCGACGGTGCSQRDGGGDFTGSQSCCSSGVRGLNRVCSASVGAPCLVPEDDDDTPTGDFICDGVQKGEFCCTDGCGECGGSGCSNRGGGLTGDDCCTSDIRESGRVCSVTRAAPCLFD